MQSTSESAFKRLLRSSPWMRVSIILIVMNAAFTLLSPIYSLPTTTAALANLFALFLGLVHVSTQHRKQLHREVIEALREALDDLSSIFNQDNEASPLRLMTYLSSLPDKNKPLMSKDAQKVLLEKTSVINQILIQEFKDCITSLSRIDPSLPSSKEPITWVAEDSWRTLNWYRVNVIEALRELRENKAVSGKSVEDSLAKFRMSYNDALKDLRAARERANKELDLHLDTNIDGLVIGKI